MVIRTLRTHDVDPLASAFANWPKPRDLFETYARRVAENLLEVLVATVDSHLAGYLLISPRRRTHPSQPQASQRSQTSTGCTATAGRESVPR